MESKGQFEQLAKDLQQYEDIIVRFRPIDVSEDDYRNVTKCVVTIMLRFRLKTFPEILSS